MATAASPSIIRVIARRSASDIARIACASATPACSLSRQMGRLMPTIAIQPRPLSHRVGRARCGSVAIGRNMSRITCTSASARTISARPAASSGRDVKAALMADQGGSGCANARDASAGTGRSASSARLVLSIASAPRTSPTSARASASSRATSTSARKHVGLRRGSAGVSRIRRADDVAREHDLLRDERCRPPSLLQHQEGVGRLYADVQAWSGSRRRVADRHLPERMRGGGRECRTSGICCSIVKLTSAPPSMNGK